MEYSLSGLMSRLLRPRRLLPLGYTSRVRDALQGKS